MVDQPNVVVTATATDGEPAVLARQIMPVVNELVVSVSAPGAEATPEQMARLLEALRVATLDVLTEQLDLVAEEAAAARAQAEAEMAAAEAAAAKAHAEAEAAAAAATDEA